MKQYFKILSDTLENHKLKNSPRQIYKIVMRHYFLLIVHKESITLKKSEDMYLPAQGTPKLVTMLCAAFAASLPLPPMIIYSKSFPGGGRP